VTLWLHSYVLEDSHSKSRILRTGISNLTPTSKAQRPRHNTVKILHAMCQYWRIESLCGHSALMAGPSCYLIYEQLQRINDPAERTRYDLPFEIPQQCLPNGRNIQRRYVNDYCSWECRNNGLYADRRCGAPGARYGPGSERIGVGWRY
jgi:hypothetical protein